MDDDLPKSENDPLTYRIIGCAMLVHRALGPGLLESIYDECLNRGLVAAGFHVARQPTLEVTYEGDALHRNYRPDFIVDTQVIVEVKSVASIQPVHVAQGLTYMKLSGLSRGLIINFNVAVLARGVKRLIMTPQPPVA